MSNDKQGAARSYQPPINSGQRAALRYTTSYARAVQLAALQFGHIMHNALSQQPVLLLVAGAIFVNRFLQSNS